MKNVYITGIYGLLGSNLAYKLKDRFNISGCGRSNDSFKTIDTDCLDLTDFDKAKDILSVRKPDIIIHSAAAVNVDECEEHPEIAELANVKVTKNLSDICKKNGIKLIFISTDAVFDGLENRLYVEEDKTNPPNIYAKTKLNAERIVLDNPGGLVLRVNIYGYNYKEKNSFGEWVYKALESKQEIKMFSDVIFSPILVNDVASVMEEVIDDNISGLYHLCGTGSISKYDFGVYLAKSFGLDSTIIQKSVSTDFGFKAKRSPDMGMSNEKICKALNIKIRTPKESIDEFKRLYNTHYQEALRGL